MTIQPSTGTVPSTEPSSHREVARTPKPTGYSGDPIGQGGHDGGAIVKHAEDAFEDAKEPRVQVDLLLGSH